MASHGVCAQGQPKGFEGLPPLSAEAARDKEEGA